MIKLDFLKTVSLFSTLDESMLSAIQKCCLEKQFTKNDRIFAEGDEATYLGIVQEGEVALRLDLGRPTSDRNTLSLIGPTKTFGWSSLVWPHRYRLSAYVVSDRCSVVLAEGSCLLSLFDKDPLMGYRVMTKLAWVIAKRFDLRQTEIAEERGYNVSRGW